MQDQAKKDQCEIGDEEIKQRNCQICIKSLQTKFMPYVNLLNSSILIAKSRPAKSTKGEVRRQRSCGYESENSHQMDSLEMHSYGGFQNSRKHEKKIGNSSYRVIEGRKVSEKVHGKALLQLKNGSIFDGIVQNGELKQGTLKLTNGTVYRGQFKNQKPDGMGALILTNGTQYRATFTNGRMENRGEIVYDNGDVYKGQIKRYKKHGFGELTLRNGDKYIGDFDKGEITGQGVYYVKSVPVAEGAWKNGQFQGNNKYQARDTIIQRCWRA